MAAYFWQVVGWVEESESALAQWDAGKTRWVAGPAGWEVQRRWEVLQGLSSEVCAGNEGSAHSPIWNLRL